MKGKGTIILAVILGILLLGGCSAFSGYKQLVSLDEAAQSQWANVDNQLQRRYDLIPNLVETVRGYAAHEEKVFTDIAEARKAYFSAPPDQRAQAAGGVESALSRLLMLQETYPQLRANEGFLKLQDSLEGSENRIAVERGRYNEAAKALNAHLRSPTGALANLFAHVDKRAYFETSEAARTAPKVDFGQRAPTAP
jgi:LemA protein